MTVEITGSPYGFTVKDATGRAVLATAGGGAGDGYGSVGWTSGKVFLDDIVDAGYYAFDTALDPWRDHLRVTAASVTPTSVELMLDGGNGGCVHVTHTISGGALRVEARLDHTKVAPRAWEAAFATPADEGFLGFGERYNRIDQRGRSLYSWPEEGGLAKAEGTLASADNPWPNGETMTYYPVPFFLSTAGYGFWLDSTWRNQFDLATDHDDAWRVFDIGPSLAFEIYVPDTTGGDARPWPLQVIDQFTAATGRPMIPPAWSFGPRRRINHGTLINGVPEMQAMRDNDLAITVADDTEHFAPNGNDLGNETMLRAWVQSGLDLGYKMTAYYNPYLSADSASPLASKVQEGIDNDYFLKNSDGTPSNVWLISGGGMNVYTVDVSNDAANAWFTAMFQRALDLGYVGWMYDFGEYVQPQVLASNGMTGEEFHNLFPVLYDKAAHDALEKMLPGDWYYFSRSGYTGSQQYAPMVWSGDPDASFDDAEGLPAQMRAGITLSMSGVAHWGSDIGGFKCQNDGGAGADGELLTRWIEAGSMSSNMHDEDACSGGSGKATIWSSPDAQTAWRTYARLHTRMLPYFVALAADAHATGAPVVRSPWVMHPERRELAPVGDAFYVGPSLYAAPVVARGATTKDIVLPPGLFVDWHDGTLLDGGSGGVTATVPAALDKLPLLLVDGALLPLLDPTIDTDIAETNADVVGLSDVADVYDVVGVVSKSSGAAQFTLADGGTLSATYSGNLAACATCTVTPLGARLQEVKVEATGDVDAGGLHLSSSGVGRRLRWDLYVVD
ncbi:MAG TPA: TIM-barrel domain-containing protein [Polyangia bacterium]|nr:TIM-barrel domain-containing protein [Polyangia bacterium]